MKIIAFFTMLLMVFAASSQNFTVQNGALIWQRVYENPDNLPVQPLLLQLTGISNNGSDYSGQIAKSPVNYAGYGMKRIQMPLYMTKSFSASVYIEVKAGKYRVTVSNILFEELYDESILTTETASPVGNWCLNSSGEIKESQKKALATFDQDLTARFTISPTSEKW